MFIKFKISCDEATTICDKSQYGEASWKEIIKLKLHFLFCKLCRLYSKQNTFLSLFYKEKAQICTSEKHTLTNEYKMELKEKIKNIK